MPVNFVFQTYHLMVAMFGLVCLILLLALIFGRRKQIEAGRGVAGMKWLQWVLILSPIVPFLAIQSGWLTAEVGRQPYVVYPSNSAPDGVSLLTANGTSASVQPFELVVTLVLFFAVYIMLFVGWARVIGRFVSEGPVHDGPVAATASDADISFKGLVEQDESGACASDEHDARLDVELEEYVEESNADAPDVEEGLIEPLDATSKGGDAK